jgi:hypothetical protein
MQTLQKRKKISKLTPELMEQLEESDKLEFEKYGFIYNSLIPIV